jgi:hypothetical protein
MYTTIIYRPIANILIYSVCQKFMLHISMRYSTSLFSSLTVSTPFVSRSLNLVLTTKRGIRYVICSSRFSNTHSIVHCSYCILKLLIGPILIFASSMLSLPAPPLLLEMPP